MAERSKYENLELTSTQVLELAGPLATLIESPAWAAYIELLKGRRIQYREILQRGSKDAFDRIAGLVDGLEEAADLPATVIRLAQLVGRREEVEAEKPARRRYAGLDDAGGPSFG